jgi:hypothetical protein
MSPVIFDAENGTGILRLTNAAGVADVLAEGLLSKATRALRGGSVRAFSSLCCAIEIELERQTIAIRTTTEWAIRNFPVMPNSFLQCNPVAIVAWSHLNPRFKIYQYEFAVVYAGVVIFSKCYHF